MLLALVAPVLVDARPGLLVMPAAFLGPLGFFLAFAEGMS